MKIKHMKQTVALLTAMALVGFHLTPLTGLPTAQAQTPPPAPTAPPAPTPPPAEPTPPPAPTAPPAPTPPPAEPTPPPAPTPPPTATPTPTASPTSSPAPSPTASADPSPSPSSSPDSTSEPLAETSSSDGESSDNQTGDTEVETGDATTNGTITNDGNTNSANLAGSDSSEGSSVVNEGNGSGSTNDSSATVDNDTTLNQDNVADVNNSLVLDSTTGDNSASRNVGDSEIETGDANVAGTIVNSVNTNTATLGVAEFNIIEDHNGDYILVYSDGCVSGCGGSATAVNTNNGSESTNSAEIVETNDQATFQNNDANVANNMVLTADSGNNTADNNTGGDSTIETGNANVTANVLNFLNNNVYGNVLYSTVNIYGDMVGDIIMPEEYLAALQAINAQNGSGSTNTSSVDQTNNQTVEQTNTANIDNNLDITATTGDNRTSDNTGGTNDIETGDANVEAQVVNVANNNVTSDQPVWLVFVQEAGQWVGRIVGAPEQLAFWGSEGLEFSVDDNGEVTASNGGGGTQAANTNNGSDSTNDASVSQTNNETVNQTNNAAINNNVTIDANTGGNSTSRNTNGDNSIETGDVNVIANIVNFVNNNIVGDGTLAVTFVNVFGNWLGDFVGPGMEKQENDTHGSDSMAETNHESGLAIGGREADNSKVEETPAPTPETLLSEEQTEEESESLLVAATQNGSQTGFGSGQGSVAGSSDEVSSTSSLEELLNQVSAQRQARQPVRINLAWLLLLLPAIGVPYLIRKKVAQVA